MTLDDIKVFVAACQAGNLSAVARTLGCTQSAVSQHITRLEKELGATLLERGATGVYATPIGVVLRDAAAESLNVLTSGIRRVHELSGMTITTGGTSVRHFLRDSVVRFRAEFPDTVVSFRPANTTDRCIELVRCGEVDLALVTLERTQRGIEDRLFARQDLRLLVPTDSPIANRKRLKLRDLQNIRYIGLPSETSSGELIEKAFSEQNVDLDRVMTVDDFDTACVFVELGLGYSIVPAVQAANFVQSARVKAINIVGLTPIPISLVARRWASLSSVANAFVDMFIAALKKLSRTPGVELLI